jgi:hypothetical protein
LTEKNATMKKTKAPTAPVKKVMIVLTSTRFSCLTGAESMEQYCSYVSCRALRTLHEPVSQATCCGAAHCASGGSCVSLIMSVSLEKRNREEVAETWITLEGAPSRRAAAKRALKPAAQPQNVWPAPRGVVLVVSRHEPSRTPAPSLHSFCEAVQTPYMVGCEQCAGSLPISSHRA